MANISAPRDNNRVPVIIGTSSTDGKTPVTIYADPTTHRLLVDLPGGGTVPNFADAEIPTGAINDANTIFTLANAPNPAASLVLSVNGQVLAPVGVDFTLTGSTITINIAPATGSPILAWYRY